MLPGQHSLKYACRLNTPPSKPKRTTAHTLTGKCHTASPLLHYAFGFTALFQCGKTLLNVKKKKIKEKTLKTIETN